MKDPILIVDDEKDNLEALKRLLRSEYEVSVTDSAFEALKMIQKETFHVIVSDQRMPEMTGVELLEKSKAICPNTTRILLTGYTDVESVIGAINRGNIYRYVAKPWDPEDLNITLRQANESFKLREEISQKNRALEISNQELKNALEELTLLDKAKSRFLSLISHELNTPLTILSSFVSLIDSERENLPQDVSKAISSMGKASLRLEEIIGEVLAFVRLESDSRLQFSELDFEKATVDIVGKLEGLRGEKQVAFAVKKKGTPIVSCDAEKMREALTHLLRDAIRRSSPSSQIQVAIVGDKDGLSYCVERGGEILSPQALEPLDFGGDKMNHRQNLGLGLAICRTIVERHGGKVELNSSSKERTILTIYLPDPR